MNEINHKELFKQPGVSAYSINQYMQSPRRFWKTSSFNPNRIKEEPSPALKFGQLIHCLILQPELVERDFAIIPREEDIKDVLTTVPTLKEFINARLQPGQKIKSDAKKEDLIKIALQLDPDAPVFDVIVKKFFDGLGKTAVTKEEFDKATEMQSAMFANPDVKALLGNGCSEDPITWRREENGLMCKIKLDYNRAGLILDYKTTEDAGEEDFSRSICNWGYHRQMAWGMEGIEKTTGTTPRGAVILAQEKSDPEEIMIYALTAQDIALGRRENDAVYNAIKGRLKSGDWARAHGIQPISLPAWYYKKAEERLEKGL